MAFSHHDSCIRSYLFCCNKNGFIKRRFYQKEKNHFPVSRNCGGIRNAVWQIRSKLWSALVGLLPGPHVTHCFASAFCFKIKQEQNNPLSYFKFFIGTFHSFSLLFLLRLGGVYAVLEDTVLENTLKKTMSLLPEIFMHR